MGTITLYGYHVTDTKNCENILNNDFTYEENLKHYLGQGAYFFSELNTAKLNMSNNNISYGVTKSKSILKCCIITCANNFLDLDNSLNNTKFRIFWNMTYNQLKANNIQLVFKDEKDFTANKHLYYKCYMIDLYAEKYKYKVITKTFSIDVPSYGESIENIKFSGLPYIEKYICVKDICCIEKKEVIYSNNREDVLFI